jgi:flagellar hook-associated protein 1 FlgK
MSLSVILNTAAAALTNTEFKIAVTNNNIANADDPSYSRKTVSSGAISSTAALTVSTTNRVADAYLTKLTATSAASSAYDQAISSALTTYDAALGTVNGGDDLSSRLQDFQTSLTNLSTSGADSGSKAKAVAAATTLAGTIQGLSSSIQSLRTQANTDIASTVNEINASTSTIADLNRQIVATSASGGDVTDLEDQRDAALQTLSTDIGVSYYVAPDNTMQVYTSSGDSLVSGKANALSYSPASTLSATATYPDQISGITLAGRDITTSVTSGKLGGLINLRDDTLVQEQSKLDSLSSALISAANTALNGGSAYPPPSSLHGVTAVDPSQALSGSGQLRVAVTDSSGDVVSSTDLDLSSYSTVDDLVTALNGIPGLSAQLDSQGRLSLQTSDATQGVALADMSASVGPSATGVSAFFGLNNLFNGSSASDIVVNPAIANSPDRLPTGTLSTSSTLAVGDIAVASGDTTTSDALNTVFGTPRSFTAAGGMPTQSTSLQSYATDFVSSAANVVSSASSAADASSAVFSAAQSRLQNFSGVNTNEEMTQLSALQQQYQANAQMISTARTLFQTLVTMMNAT